MFGFFKKKKEARNTKDLVDSDGNIIERSSLVQQGNQRYLKLSDDSCAIILHGDNNAEVIFTTFDDRENQTVTENEEHLMIIAALMKRPGFMEMLTDEFRKVANANINSVIEEEDRD